MRHPSECDFRCLRCGGYFQSRDLRRREMGGSDQFHTLNERDWRTGSYACGPVIWRRDGYGAIRLARAGFPEVER